MFFTTEISHFQLDLTFLEHEYTFGIIQRVNQIGGLIILSYLRSDQLWLYKLKKPTTRRLHSSSFQLVQLYDDRHNGSTSKRDMDGYGWTTRTTRKKIMLQSGANR
ncbi:unnamed protein product [Caenorhabditis nigoni]